MFIENTPHEFDGAWIYLPGRPRASAIDFDAIIAISVFTHLTELSEQEFLQELHRIADPTGRLFLTVHGARALERALSEETILKMLDVPRSALEAASERFKAGQHAFILQQGHLTRAPSGPVNPSAVIAEPYRTKFLVSTLSGTVIA